MSLEATIRQTNTLITELQPSVWQKIRGKKVPLESKYATITTLAECILSFDKYQLNEETQKNISALQAALMDCQNNPDLFDPERLRSLWKPIKVSLNGLKPADIKVKQIAIPIQPAPAPLPSSIQSNTQKKKPVLETLSEAMVRIATNEPEPGAAVSEPSGIIDAVPNNIIEPGHQIEGASLEMENKIKFENSLLKDVLDHLAHLTPITLRDSLFTDPKSNKEHAQFLYNKLDPIFKDNDAYKEHLKILYICKEHGWINFKQISLLYEYIKSF